MRHFVEGFGKVKQDCVNLGLVVHSSHPAVDCLNELRFTRQCRLESVLEVDNDVMLEQVRPHIAYVPLLYRGCRLVIWVCS